MAGSIQKISKNKFRFHYMLKGNRYSETIEMDNVRDYKTDKRLQLSLSDFITRVDKGNYCNTNFSYAEFCQMWMDDYIRVDCSKSVAPKYKSYLNNRILPYLGSYQLKEINVKILKDYFNEAKTWKTMYKGKRKNKPISRGTYEKIYEIITGSLQKAYEWEYIENNPCRKIPLDSLKLERLPSELEKLKNKTSEKIKAYNIDTYNQVLKSLDNLNSLDTTESPKKILIETALKTGFSQEELAGLEWERDYDYDNSTLSINMVQIYVKDNNSQEPGEWISKEPKVFSRKRTIKIPTSLNQLLYEYHKKNTDKKYIFFENVNFISFTNWFKKWQKINHIQPILNFHQLRHTHPTILLQKGAKVKDVSSRLGHSSIRTTLDVYVEYLKEDDDNIAKMIDEI